MGVGVGVGGGRMVDGCLSPLAADGTMVTWDGDHMAASMSHPCPVVLRRVACLVEKSSLSKFWRRRRRGCLCVVFMLLRASRGLLV